MAPSNKTSKNSSEIRAKLELGAGSNSLPSEASGMERSLFFNGLFAGFSKLEFNERLRRLREVGLIDSQDLEFLLSGGIKDLTLAEKFIENVLGYFQLPFGIATQFCIDGEDMVIPMAVEETSIVAAASKTAKWIREIGKITTEPLGNLIIGQIQCGKVRDIKKFREAILQKKEFLIAEANSEVAMGLLRRGGGVKDIIVRDIIRPDGFCMAVLHVLCDPCDAMGANIINQVCEFLKPKVEAIGEEKVTMCILSNLNDLKLTKAEVILEGVEASLAEKIEEASLFAELDPYRAATNNKGVLNGMDPILIATGNDWRAVEAGVHAYAAHSGQYRSITKWQRTGDTKLIGTLIAPIVVGTVGGVTNLHPMARLSLKLLGNPTAERLSQIIAAAGLVQNLGALKALTTVGIIEGHMKLHIKNLTLGAGAEEAEAPILQKKLEEILQVKKRISLNHAIEVLKELRRERVTSESVHGST